MLDILDQIPEVLELGERPKEKQDILKPMQMYTCHHMQVMRIYVFLKVRVIE
jgi:hypothetical protein